MRVRVDSQPSATRSTRHHGRCARRVPDPRGREPGGPTPLAAKGVALTGPTGDEGPWWLMPKPYSPRTSLGALGTVVNPEGNPMLVIPTDLNAAKAIETLKVKVFGVVLCGPGRAEQVVQAIDRKSVV